MHPVHHPRVEVVARDEATHRLIEELRQRHVRLLMQAALRRGGGRDWPPPGGQACEVERRPEREVIDGGSAADPNALALEVDAVADRSTHAKAPSGTEVVAPIRLEASNVGPGVNREPAILVDYKEAAYLLSLCKAKPGDTAPDQAERRGVDALKQRVASGKIPPRCIKRSGRRVQFVRIALIEWACGRGRVQT